MDMQYQGAVSGCSIRVQYQGVVSGCSIRVQYQGAVSGCSIRMQYQDAVSGARTLVIENIIQYIHACGFTVPKKNEILQS